MGEIIPFPGIYLPPPPPNLAAPPASEADGDGEGDDNELWAALCNLQQGGHVNTLTRELRWNLEKWRTGDPGSVILDLLLGVFPYEDDAKQFMQDLDGPTVPAVPRSPTWDDCHEDDQRLLAVLGRRDRGLRICTLTEHLRENFAAWYISRAGEDRVWPVLGLFPDRDEAGHFLAALDKVRPLNLPYAHRNFPS